MKKRKAVLICITIIFAGLSVLLYPTIADYWNSMTQSKALVDYEGVLANMKSEDYTEYFEEAKRYNQELFESPFPFSDSTADEEYMSILNVDGSGIIGSLSIEKIRVELPIYHTVSDDVLAKAAGHMPGTSFPIGGENSHAVISAHRGLPSAKLFTNLDDLELGDVFQINVLDKVLTYEVDQIRIVEPDEVEDLYITEGQDYVTLLTCTPYGINTHRLLVRGTRIDEEQVRRLYVAGQGHVIDPVIIMPVVAVPMLLIFLIYSWTRALLTSKKKKQKSSEADILKTQKEQGEK